MDTSFDRPQYSSASAESNAPIRRDTATTAFASGNIVVCRVGTGAAALTSAATEAFLDEYTPAGSYVSTVALPTTVSGNNQVLTLSGTGANECQITLSGNRAFITVAGYAAIVGTGPVASSSGPRTIARVNAAGTVDSSTTTTSFFSSAIRSATTYDGSGFWAVGSSGGVIYMPLGGGELGTAVSTSLTNNRVINVFNGQLYTSDASGSTYRLTTVGSGLPTTTGNTMTNLPGILPNSGSPNAYFFADLDASVAGLDTLYIADESTNAGAGGGGVKKFSLVGGSWTYNGTFPASITPAIPATIFYGLAGSASGTTVTLFATRSNTAGNQLVKFVDTTGYNVAPTAVPTQLATAAANTVFRGVSMVPQLAPTAANVSLGGRVLTSEGFGLKGAVITLEGGDLIVPRTVTTGPFGYYQFNDLRVGLTYVITINSKRYSFANPTRVINLDAELQDADFKAEP